MTPKQQAFVAEYLIDLNATQAAIRAGYSEKTAAVQGFENLRKPNIAEAIAAARTKLSERTEITQDWVLRTIYETAERCRQAEPVLDRKGQPVMVETPAGKVAAAYTFKEMGVLKAAELAGKHLGTFQDRPISIKLPKIETTEDIVKASAAIVNAVANGELTPSEGQSLASIIETHRRTVELEDVSKRMTALEQEQAKNKKGRQL